MTARLGVLRVYPIKGLDPAEVSEARLLASGALECDRRWALRDSRGRFVNGKNFAAIHGIRAEYHLDRTEVTLEGRTFSLSREGEAIARWFGERLGEPLEWVENPHSGFPDDTDSPGPTLVSRASLEQVAQWFSLPLEQVRRRFRTNLEVDSVEPFWEDQLYGRTVRVGAVTLFAVNPCQRCVVPSRDAWTGEQDTGFQKRFAELRRAHLPAFARTEPFTHFYRLAVNTRLAPESAGGILRVGDVVSAG